MKKILFWSPFIGNVGTKNAVLQSALSLSKSYDCKIINAVGEFDENSNFLKKNNIHEIKLVNNRIFKLLPQKGFFWSRFYFLLIFIFTFYPLFKILNKNQKDSYLFIYLITSLPLLMVRIFDLNTKIIFRISGKINVNFLRKFIYKFSSKKIHAILVQTSKIKKKIEQLCIFNSKKVFFCEDPIIDLNKIEILKKETIEVHYRSFEYYVAIGRLTKQKNFTFLISVMKEIFLKNANIKLLILGDGEEYYLLQNLIKKYELSDKIFLVGFRENIYKYLDRAKGLICTSLWEEPGFVIQEAAACKKIIITSDCPNGPEEFLNFGKNGYVFKSNSRSSFVSKFQEMLNDTLEHEEMIKNSYINSLKYTKKSFEKKISKIINY